MQSRSKKKYLKKLSPILYILFEFRMITFSNVTLDELNIDVDVAKKLSSPVNYNISENLDKLFVDLIGELKLTLNYNYDSGIIILNNIRYKLKN